MDSSVAVVVFGGVLVLVAVSIGMSAAGLYRSTRSNMPAEELRRKAMAVFWIIAVIALAGEILVIGTCLANIG